MIEKTYHKTYHTLRRQWMLGKLDLVATTKRLGYKRGSMSKGVTRVRTILSEMGITVL